MNTIMFRCPCGHVWPVPDIMTGKPATCPGCDEPSGPEGFLISSRAPNGRNGPALLLCWEKMFLW